MFMFVASCSLGLALLLLFQWLRPKKTRLPPSPMVLPFLGHLHLLLAGPPYRQFMKLSKKLGPFFCLRLGSVPVVVGASPEFVRDIYKPSASRPASITRSLLFYDQPDVLFSPYGDDWRNLRRLCVQHLLTARKIKEYQDLRREEILQLVSNILAFGPGKNFNLQDNLTHFSFNIITRTVMSKRYFGCSSNVADIQEGATFIDLIHEIFQLMSAFPIGEYLPLLRGLDLDGMESRCKKAAKKVDLLLGRIIEDHQARRQQRVATEGGKLTMDFIDVLLELRDNGEKLLQNTNSIRGVVLDMILGGTDTSSVTIAWAMAELIKHPSIMSKVQTEIMGVVGESRLVKEADIEHMPYLQVVVKETFRLHPAGPILGPRCATEDSTIMKYHIPAGASVFVNIFQLGRDPSIWQEPLEFKPKRFMESKIDVQGHDFQLVPFGLGRRICPGMLLALTSVHTTLANLVHAFDWQLPPGQVVDTDAENSGLIVTIKKLEPIAHARLPSEVYK